MSELEMDLCAFNASAFDGILGNNGTINTPITTETNTPSTVTMATGTDTVVSWHTPAQVPDSMPACTCTCAHNNCCNPLATTNTNTNNAHPETVTTNYSTPALLGNNVHQVIQQTRGGVMVGAEGTGGAASVVDYGMLASLMSEFFPTVYNDSGPHSMG